MNLQRASCLIGLWTIHLKSIINLQRACHLQVHGPWQHTLVLGNLKLERAKHQWSGTVQPPPKLDNLLTMVLLCFCVLVGNGLCIAVAGGQAPLSHGLGPALHCAFFDNLLVEERHKLTMVGANAASAFREDACCNCEMRTDLFK